MPDDIIFEARKWGTEVYSSIQMYWHLHVFMKEDRIQEHAQAHNSRKGAKVVEGGMLFEDGTISPISDDDFEPDAHTIILSPEEITVNLRKAGQTHNRQMIVVSSTYIELILRDFLRVIFCKFPNRMYDYLNEGNGGKGLVSLKTIVKATSISDLLDSLSEQAASNALKGKLKSQLNNLNRIAPEQVIPQYLQDKLIKIVELRNRIVHEASQVQISEEDVGQTLDVCLELIASLAEAAVKCDISLDIPKDQDEEFPF